jgi:hypothetical protein
VYIVVQHFRNASHAAFELASVRKNAALKVVPASTIVKVGVFFPSIMRYIKSILSSLLKTIFVRHPDFKRYLYSGITHACNAGRADVLDYFECF